MSGLSIGKAPENHAVLPFYGTAAFFFLLLSILMFFSEDKFTVHYFSPHILTIVHLAALGWGTMIIFGAAYQLLPVICERDLFSSNMAFTSYCFLTIGILILAGSFWYFQLGWLMISGGSFILIAVSIYLLNVFRTAAIFQHFTFEKLFVLSSALWLFLTVMIGLLLTINLAFPFFEKNHLEILKLHAHAGLAGWFLQLITGVSIKLVPMFLLGKSNKTHLIRWSFIFQNTGLILFLLDGYFLGITSRSLFYAFLLFLGVLLWLIYIRDVFKNRMKKKIDFSMRHTFLSFSCLIIALLFIPIVYYSTSVKWSFIYGVFLFLGWISSIILGMTFKTLPFIVWNNHYKNLNGKMKIPLPKHLYSEKILKIQFWIFLFSIYILALSILFEQPIALRLALGLWVVVAVLYTINVGKILTHKTTTLDGNIN